MGGNGGGVTQRLKILQSFFALTITGATEDVREVVQPVLDCERLLRREERRVTFFGAVKAGKSSLLNAIIGVPLLPTRARGTASTVTTVRYGVVPGVSMVRGGVEEEIPFDEADAVIRRSLSEDGPAGIDEVHIAVPLPLLVNRCMLVDTPGLLEEEALTERTRLEIERTDIAVMVLSADKILSAAERDAARRVQDLLHGNVVFVVNRLDTVDEEDVEEVLDWARDALQRSGNELVGAPRIFATSARRTAEGDDGTAELQRWLAETLSSDLGDEIAALSRLGVLEHHLVSAHAHLHLRLEEARAVAERARQEEADDIAKEKARIRGELAQGRVRLHRVRDGLGTLGDTFVAGCVENTRRQVKVTASGPISVRFESARDEFIEDLSEAVHDALDGLPLTVPSFDLRDWIFRAHVDPASHPTSEIGESLGDLATRVVDGGSAGREAGANLGAWIGKNILRVDVEAETLKRIEHVAQASAVSLRAEAERYLARMETLLDEADHFYEGWTRAAPRVAAAEEPERYYRGLTVWADAFLQEVREMIVTYERPST